MMQTEELEDILLTISFKEENEKASLVAFNLLYKEYSKILSAIVKKNLKDMGIFDEQFHQAVINNVFYKLYEKPLSFSVPKDAKNDNCFKAWLSVVARNELLSQIKQYNRKEYFLDTAQDESLFDSVEIKPEIASSVNFKLMQGALNSLSQRDREIMITLYNYYEEGKNTPIEILNEIATLHKTTKPNIRKIKQRSEKKIIEYFSKRSKLTPIKNGK